MTIIRNLASVTDDGLLFSNISVTEDSSGAVNSIFGTADNLQAVGAANSPIAGAIAGLTWGGFNAGTTGASQTLTLTIEYDLSSLSAATLITAIRSNSFTPDTTVAAGTTLSLREEIYDSATNTLVAVSQLTKTSTLNDSGDPPFEAGDQQLALGYASLHVKLTVVVSTSGSVPAGSAASFSVMNQTFNTTAASALASLGDFIFEDKNADGIQQAGESGIAGVTVQLLNSSGTAIASTTTDGAGAYHFNNIIPGSYAVKVSTPDGYVASPANQGSDDTRDSDAVGGVTQQVTLAAGASNPTLDAGFYRTATIGDFAFEDKNADGIQQAGEAGISGITVQLLNSAGVQVGSTTTDSHGNYSFTGLVPGTYSVQFVAPAGYVATGDNLGNDDAKDSDAVGGVTQQVTVSSGEVNNTLDAGYFKPAAIGDFVFEDKNADGIQQAGEAGISGVTVQLLDSSNAVVGTTTTDAQGGYHFTGIAPGTYSVQFVTPAGYVATGANLGNDDAKDSDAVGGVTQQVTVSSGEVNNTLDAGYFKPAAIGDFVFEDKNADGIQQAGEAGISGVTVQLLDSSNAVVGTTTTDAQGGYHFTGIAPGTYSVQFVTPAGYVATGANLGNDDAKDSDAVGGVTQQVTVSSGEVNNTLDAGYFKPAAIGDFVFEDKNADGIQQAGEAGISGVTVQLLDSSNAVIGTTTTDAQGGYHFTGIAPGTYSVQFVTPAGYVATGANLGNDDAKDSDAVGGVTQQVTVSSGEVNNTLDAGYFKPAAIGDFVFEDKNADGIQQAGEAGISGVTVQLLDSSNAVVGTTTTDAQGGYHFTGIAPGTYSVQFVTPAGYVATGANLGNDDAKDSDAVGGVTQQVTVSSGEVNNTLDAGYFKPAAIGDFVFEDKNADGIQQAGEAGISGVTVQLLDSSNAVVGTTTTDAQGGYQFTGIAPGTYSVQFVTPAGYVATGANLGNDDAKDSDAVGGVTQQVTVSSGEVNNTLDAGYFHKAGLGDFVFNDANANGIQDAGEAGIAGVTVQLLNGSGAVIGTTSTNAQGGYSFTDLVPGTYSVHFVTPNGYVATAANIGNDDARDSDAVGGTTQQVTLTSGSFDGTLDAGFYRPVVAAPGIDIEKTTSGSTNSNPVAPNWDNEDAANGPGVPVLVAGSDVTWTYKVANTGNTSFARSEIVIVDDNGTSSTADDMSVANGKISLISKLGGNQDDVLDAGESWIYQATGVVQNLSAPGTPTTFDFSGNSALDGTHGNIRSYSSGGIAVKVAGFSRVDGADGNWSTGWLGSYAGGLGVTNDGDSTTAGCSTTTIGSGTDTLVLKISQDAWNGSAQYTISVDGVQVGGTLTASALHGACVSDTVTVLGNWATGGHNVSVNFVNDSYGGTSATDRNLYVDGATYNGVTVGGASLALMGNGAQSFCITDTGCSTTTIAAASTSWC